MTSSVMFDWLLPDIRASYMSRVSPYANVVTRSLTAPPLDDVWSVRDPFFDLESTQRINIYTVTNVALVVRSSVS